MEKEWELKVKCDNNEQLQTLVSHLLLLGNVDFNVKVLMFGVIGYDKHGFYEVTMSSRYPNLTSVSHHLDKMKIKPQ